MNRLARESSPYLQQHAQNPIDWYPWGPEAFAAAREQNKPIFLSIGYSTCYWCHVMEKECFESQDVARALGDFIAIKVDREEHPEVDSIYMDAVVAMTGRGGWPMSVFLTPALQPFWGGSYIPKDPFLQLTGQVSEAWKKAPGDIQSGSDRLMTALLQEQIPNAPAAPAGDENIFRLFLNQASSRFDAENGGFGPKPKFPSSVVIRLLLRLSRLPESTGTVSALEMAEKSLSAMASGGIFDHVGGGFHRYSVDERWVVPHFEKMLTDNALLAIVYLEAFQLTGKEIYAGVARETLDYLLRDMRAPGGGFYAAEDAGPVGLEGEFYVWAFEELEALPDFKEFYRHFAVTKEGNFERGKNIICLGEPEDFEPSRAGGSAKARAALLAKRATRPRPHRDEKILTAWNGLAISALAMGASTFGDAGYLKAAEEGAAFLRKELWKEGKLLRRWIAGEAKYDGNAADYAYVIDGLIQLYQAGFREEHLLWARELQAVLDRDFWDENKGGYFTAAKAQENLVVRKKERSDGALPSPNSVAFRNLLSLAQYFHEPALRERANALGDFLKPWLERIPFAVAEGASALYYRSRGEKLIAANGMSASDLAPFRTFLPEALLACAPKGSASNLPVFQGRAQQEPAVTICEAGVCRAPQGLAAAVENLAGIASS